MDDGVRELRPVSLLRPPTPKSSGSSASGRPQTAAASTSGRITTSPSSSTPPPVSDCASRNIRGEALEHLLAAWGAALPGDRDRLDSLDPHRRFEQAHPEMGVRDERPSGRD